MSVSHYQLAMLSGQQTMYSIHHSKMTRKILGSAKMLVLPIQRKDDSKHATQKYCGGAGITSGAY